MSQLYSGGKFTKNISIKNKLILSRKVSKIPHSDWSTKLPIRKRSEKLANQTKHIIEMESTIPGTPSLEGFEI